MLLPHLTATWLSAATLLATAASSALTHHIRRQNTTNLLLPTTPPPPTAWREAKCEGVIVDPRAQPDKRWAAAGASDALAEMLAAWNEYWRLPNPGEVVLEFSEFAAHFFGGPEMRRCTRLFDVPCAVPLTCADTIAPAGYLILNSIAKLHQFHRRYYEALDAAQVDIQSEMDLFAEKFSVPKAVTDNSAQMQRIMLNVMYGIVGIAQSYTNNLFVYSTIFQGFATQTWRAQMTTTSSYTIFTSWAVGKDYLLPTEGDTPAYGTLSELMGDTFDKWKGAEVEYLRRMFTPKDPKTIEFLIAALDNGLMGAAPDDLDFREMSKTIKKLFYPSLMLAAWSAVPTSRRPFVLQTNLPCHMKQKEMAGAMWPFMLSDSHERAAVCYEGALFYLLDIRSEGIELSINKPSIRPSENNPLMALYGTETFDGTLWGGVTKEDLIAAVYGGWIEGGRRNDNFEMNSSNIMPEMDSPMWHGKGIRLPGYVKMPLCNNLYTIVANIAWSKPDEGPNTWPCTPLVDLPNKQP